MNNQTVTVLCITTIGCLAIWLGPEYAKDILLTAVGGLVGYLAGETLHK